MNATTTRFTLLTGQQGVNYVKVPEAGAAGGNNVLWHFSLDGGSEPIVFAAFCTRTRFAVSRVAGLFPVR